MKRGKNGGSSQTRGSRRPFALTALALAVSMQAAYAQTVAQAAAPASAGDTTLPTVSVRADTVAENYGPAGKKSISATKSDISIEDTPQSISVVTADQIRNQGATTVEESLRYSAGVRTQPIVDTRRGTFYIRGFNAAQNGQYLDGLKLPWSGGYGYWDVEPYSLERVDIVRGPSSVLYGQTSPGGLVNQVSKRPQAESSNEINLSFGNFDRKEVSGDFTGALDQEGKVLYRLTALARDSGTQTDKAGDDRLFIAPQITWRPSADTNFTLYTQIYHDNAGNSANFLPALGTITPLANGSKIPTSLFTGEPGFDRFKREQYIAGYEFSHRLNDTLTLRQNLRYAHQYVSYENIGSNSGLVANPPNGPYLLRRLGLRSTESFDVFTVDNQAQIKVKHGMFDHTILAGVDYTYSYFDRQLGQTAVTPANGVATPTTEPALNAFNPAYGNFVRTAYQTDSDVRRSQIGFYLQDMLRVADRFVFQAAGRYDKARVDTDTRTIATNAVANTGTNDGKFTGRAGVLWEGPYGLSPYFAYSTSFEPTGVTTLYGGGTPKPTTGKQYEAGLKFQPVGSRSFAQLSLFNLTQENVLTTSPVLGQFSQIGEVRSRGVELEGTWAVTPNLNVLASYTYTDAEVTAAGPSAPNAGKTPQYIPKHMASLWADYRLSSNFGFLQGVWLGGGVRYVSKTYDQTNVTTVPAFTLFDLAASYTFAKHYTLRLNVNNLFDKTYVAACDSATNCYYGRRRTIIGTASYRW